MKDALIVGTAGHIDHGKTSLVRSLTGVDLDRLPEEQERGITIALGFTALKLPDGRTAAFVDVPGHERLVRTMVAGATGIDAVLLCVSAVDGVMPQTREHLAILQLLGLEHGAIVLTMADLVDEELLELAQEDARDTVAGTFLADAPIVAYSSVTGRGRDELVSVIAGFPSTRREPTGAFRLPVDRAFVRPGFGTVVTGTAWSGALRDGSSVTLLPGGAVVRVRGIEVHGESVEQVEAGSRAALNLAGAEKDDVPRGTVVTVGDVPCAQMVDVTYRHLDAADPLPDGAPVRVLLGTSEQLGHLYVADDLEEIPPGADVPAQLRLDGPLPCVPGDRFVIRRTSPLETLGGGVIVDPWTRRMRKDREAFGRQILRLARGERMVLLERAGEDGLTDAEWSARRGPADDLGEKLGDRWFAPTVVARLQGALLEALTTFHAENPLALGAHRRELRRGRLGHLTDRVFDALVERLADNRQVQVDGPMLRVAGFAVELTPAQIAVRDAIVASLVQAGTMGLTPKELHEKHPQPEVASLLRLLETDGAIAQVPGLGWMASATLSDIERRVRGWFVEHPELSTGEFKDLTETTRKAAIPLLEWLDKNRVTRREGDTRVPGPAIVAARG